MKPNEDLSPHEAELMEVCSRRAQTRHPPPYQESKTDRIACSICLDLRWIPCLVTPKVTVE